MDIYAAEAKLMIINVVIPSYNYGKYIESSVNSVIAQSYPGLRVIIVDDGSADNTREIGEALAAKDERIIYIHQENGGVSKARNTGIDYVMKNKDGFEYITFLDADDLWRKDFFNDKVLSCLDEKRDVVCFEMCKCTDDLKKCTPPCELLESPSGKPAVEYRVIDGGAGSVRCHDDLPMGAVFYSVDLIEEAGLRFLDRLKFDEDDIFKMQALYAADKIALLKKVLYIYRTNSGSAIKTVKFNVDYYIPIVASYIKADEQMLFLKDKKDDELRWGRTLAARYTTQMIDEHFRSFGKEEEIRKILDENPKFTENLRDFSIYSKNVQNWIEAVKGNKRKYILMQKILGIKQAAVRVAKRSIILRKIKDSGMYCQENIYI